METGHSERACRLCKRRRVKCDKTLPACHRCDKLGQTCPGYPSKRKFIDQSNYVRQRLTGAHAEAPQASRQSDIHSSPTHASREHHVTESEEFELGGLSRQLSASSSNLPPHYIPSPQPNVVESNSAFTSTYVTPANTVEGPEVSSFPQDPVHFMVQDEAPEVEQISDGTSQHLNLRTESDYFDLDIEAYYANGNNACGFFPGVVTIEPESDDLQAYSDTRQSTQATVDQEAIGSHDAFPWQETDVMLDNHKGEIALLMRLFVEILAPWMDMFDIDSYFARILPLRATPDALLQFSLAAVAAKQTARYIMTRYTAASSRYYDLLLAKHRNNNASEWFYKAASYYDRGITYLRVYLQRHAIMSRGNNASTNTTFPNHVVPPNITSPYADQNVPFSASQNLLSAISILSMYENLDDCSAGSSQ